MYKYFISYGYTVGRSEYAHTDFGFQFLTLDHEITENDIREFSDAINRGKSDYRNIICITKISTDF